MSDHDDDPTSVIFRASIPGRPSNLSASRDSLVWQAPGRVALELSILLSALAILVPVCALGAIPAALVARRSGNSRWLAALIAGVWCLLLGVVVRGLTGMGLFP